MYKDYDPYYSYCGVGKLKLKADHPFNQACFKHDQKYINHPTQTTAEIDKEFYHDCLQTIPENSRGLPESRLLRQAYICYRLTRIWGAGRLLYAKLRKWNKILGDKK